MAGDGSALKHDSHEERLLHIDRNYEDWEDVFERTLRKRLSVQPASTDELPVGVGAPSGRLVRPTVGPRSAGDLEIPTVVSNQDAAPDTTSTQQRLSGLEIPSFVPNREAPPAAASTPRNMRGFQIPTLSPGPRIEQNYSRRELERLCGVRRFTVRDFTKMGGNLWVITDTSDEYVTRQLKAWGFTYKEDKGWWRKHG